MSRRPADGRAARGAPIRSEARTSLRPKRRSRRSRSTRAVAALPADFRDVIVAVDVAGLSYKEAAERSKTREGTVMSRLYRARQQVAAAVAC